MDYQILKDFVLELGFGIFSTLPLYLAAYFSSSYFLFNSPHGSISEWNKTAKDLSMAVASSKITANHEGDCSMISEVVENTTRPQIIELSACIELMARAEERLAQYKSRERFIMFGVLLSLSLALFNSLPILLGSTSFVENPLAYSGAITATFGLIFVARFNWTQSTEWNQFKESIEANKQFLAENGF